MQLRSRLDALLRFTVCGGVNVGSDVCDVGVAVEVDTDDFVANDIFTRFLSCRFRSEFNPLHSF